MLGMCSSCTKLRAHNQFCARARVTLTSAIPHHTYIHTNRHIFDKTHDPHKWKSSYWDLCTIFIRTIQYEHKFRACYDANCIQWGMQFKWMVHINSRANEMVLFECLTQSVQHNESNTMYSSDCELGSIDCAIDFANVFYEWVPYEWYETKISCYSSDELSKTFTKRTVWIRQSQVTDIFQFHSVSHLFQVLVGILSS